MGTEPQKTILKITQDVRLRAGVLAALEHVCERRGVNGEEKRQVRASIEKECEKILDAQKEPNCVIAIEEMEDRMQVTVKAASGEVYTTVVKHFHSKSTHS